MLAPLREFGPPVVDLMRPMSYVELQQTVDKTIPPGRHAYVKSDFLGALDDEALEIVAAHHARTTSPFNQILLHQLGGAIARRATGGYGVPVPFGRVDADRHRDLDRPDRGAGAARRMGSRTVGGDAALVGRHLRQPPRRRGGCSRARGVRRVVRPARRAEADVGPGERLPAEPEHHPAVSDNLRVDRRVLQMRLVVEAADYDEAVTFYRDVLGAPEELFVDSGDGARVTILDVGRATLELSTPEQVDLIDRVEVGRGSVPGSASRSRSSTRRRRPRSSPMPARP